MVRKVSHFIQMKEKEELQRDQAAQVDPGSMVASIQNAATKRKVKLKGGLHRTILSTTDVSVPTVMIDKSL